MPELLERRKTKEQVLAAFAFRCLWETKEGDMDGFTYAVDKRKLAEEIFRRKNSCDNKPKQIKVVKVDVNFTFLIESQKCKVYSTRLEKHPQDLSKE